MNSHMTSWIDLENEELENRIKSTLSEERKSLCTFLAQLNLLYRRNIHSMHGYSSLNDYLIKRLKLSKHQAFMRAAIARQLHGFPGLLTMLEKGETCMSHLALIAGRLTPANSQVLFNAAATMTKRELESFVPKVRATGEVGLGEDTITFTIRCSLQCADLMAEVQALLSHNQKNSKSHGEVLQVCLESYLTKNHPMRKAERAEKRAEKKKSLERKALEKLEKGMDLEKGHSQAVAITKRCLAEGKDIEIGPVHIKAASRPQENQHGTPLSESTRRPQRQPLKQSTRHQVMLRDGGRCTWVSPDGKRCESGKYLQLDHKKMICRGGSNELGNLRLLCSLHNRLEAARQLNVPLGPPGVQIPVHI